MKKAIRMDNAMILPIVDDVIELYGGCKGKIIEVHYSQNGENWILVELL